VLFQKKFKVEGSTSSLNPVRKNEALYHAHSIL